MSMQSKRTQGSRSVAVYETPTKRITETTITEKSVIERSPSPDKSYLEDESFEILPKTDYTYARTGSYSPRFLGKSYVNPNMSRRRMRGDYSVENSRFLDEESDMYDDYSDTGDDSVDTYITYKDVTENGMELRSGHSLKSVRSVMEEHERRRLRERGRQSISSETITSTMVTTNQDLMSDRGPGGRTSRGKALMQKGLSKSERKLTSKSKQADYSASKQGLAQTESRTSRYMSDRASDRELRSVRQSLRQRFDDIDSGQEKGSRELMEKQLKENRDERNISHLYGLDSEEEFSDSASYSTRSSRSRRSYSSSQPYRDRSESSIVTTTTTVVTTVIETITTVASPVVTPIWNTIGRPLWSYLIQPIARAVISVLTMLWYYIGQPVTNSLTNIVHWLWQSAEYIILQFVVLDVWLLKRNRARSCCLCLPLLILLPLVLLLGSSVYRSGTLFPLWSSDNRSEFVSVQNINMVHISEDIRKIIVQLQENSQKQLGVADIEAIVYRILNKELEGLKLNVQETHNHLEMNQFKWKEEQTVKLKELNSHIAAVREQIKNLTDALAIQKGALDLQRDDLKSESAVYITQLEEKIATLRNDLAKLDEAHKTMLVRLNNCCHNDSFYAAAIHDQVNAILAQMMDGQTSGNAAQDAFTAWLHSNYVSREVLDKRLEALATDLTGTIMKMVKEQEEMIRQQQQQKGPDVYIASNGTGISEQYVHTLVAEALQKYSADKTGMADFALESAGGSILSTRCSETYYRKTALVSILGIPIWYSSNSPRTVIQPDVNPGECWAFKGDKGYLVIQLATMIIPSGFTLEHIPKSLAPNGEIDSAPKDFTVIGLEGEEDKSGVSLGNYTYNKDGNPLQQFPIQISDPKPLAFIEFRVLNNHGNIHYTCIYRFRVHGKPYYP